MEVAKFNTRLCRRNLGICYICARLISGHRDRQCGHLCLARWSIGVVYLEFGAVTVAIHALRAAFVVAARIRNAVPYILSDWIAGPDLLYDILALLDRYGVCSCCSVCSDGDSHRTVFIVLRSHFIYGLLDLECKGRAFRASGQSVHPHGDF